MATLIDGKKIAQQIKDEVRETVARLAEQGIQPGLAVVLVGEDPASQVYVKNKKAACEYTGIRSFSYTLSADTTQSALLALIDQLNADPDVHGILVQLPLPPHIDTDAVIRQIDPQKDVDGFHPYNNGLLLTGQPRFLPCTPAGIIQLLQRSDIAMTGKHCVVVGRSQIVGKPAALLMLQQDATVTVVHSRSENRAELTRQADILIVAAGKPQLIGAEDVKSGAVVIDVGIHRTAEGKLCGDVAFDDVRQKASAMTPVPGGVGPMTIAMLMVNCVNAARYAQREQGI